MRDIKGGNFIRSIIDEDLEKGLHKVVRTRFPPEPNGYLHIGHAKSICLNFGLALHYKGSCNLRFDDTNPSKEEVEYVASIQNDIRWLGFEFEDCLFFASDYFEEMYQQAQGLVRAGKAYVCSLSEAEIRLYRGSVSQAGKPSPFRDRSVADNLALLEAMRKGEYAEGSHVLRAKGDMSSPNMKMRDPLLYRILRLPHDRTGDAWNIYPMYDYAHPLEDALEGITHSICTLEFENNREIYDWVIENTNLSCRPRQYEFARLSLNYTLTSKRKLLKLVQAGDVSGWDDPRMPTLAGMRRRGYTAAAIRKFCDIIGVAKANSTVDIGMLEFCVRNDLNGLAPRVMAVLNPLKLIIDNYPVDKLELLDAPSFPHDVPREGSRILPFRREVFIERDDFMEQPSRKFFRLAPDREVRLRYSYIVKCVSIDRSASGDITAIHCTYDPDTLGKAPCDRKVPGTIHWVPVQDAIQAEARLYDRLFSVESPDSGDDEFRDHLNPNSLAVVSALVEPAVAIDPTGCHYQFERLGYFYSDPVSRSGTRVFNRTVGLRDSWSKLTQGDKLNSAPAPSLAVQAKQVVKRDLSPELTARITAISSQYGISDAEAETLACHDEAMAFFVATLKTHANAKLVSAWVNNEVLRVLKEKPTLLFGPNDLGELLALIDKGTISGKIAKDVFAQMRASGDRPGEIVAQKDLRQLSDSSLLEDILDGVLAEFPDEVARFKKGEKKLLGFFMGRIMKASGGKANPQLVKAMLPKKLG